MDSHCVAGYIYLARIKNIVGLFRFLGNRY